MAINGIGSYYSNWFNNLYQGSTKGNSTTDLMTLMKKADEVRSPEYRKKMLEGNTSTDSDIGTVKSEKALSDSASKLYDSASKLSSLSLKDMEDTDTLVKKVTDFAENYNSTIDSLQKSNSVDALREGVNMKNTVGAFAGALKRIGITVGSDNKLTVDEDALKKADKNSVASVLGGNFSVTGRIAKRSEGISRSAMNKAMTTAFVDTYTNKGTASSSYMSYFTGTLFDKQN